MRNTRGNFFFTGAWCLGEKNLSAGNPELGQNSDKQDDDAHAAKPLGEAAPEKKGFWVEGKISKNRRSRCGKAGDGFKVGIKRMQAKKQVRKCTNGGHDDPGQGDDQEAIGAPEQVKISIESAIPAAEKAESQGTDRGENKSIGGEIFLFYTGKSGREENNASEGKKNYAESAGD